jgi:hypothetical protein
MQGWRFISLTDACAENVTAIVMECFLKVWERMAFVVGNISDQFSPPWRPIKTHGITHGARLQVRCEYRDALVLHPHGASETLHLSRDLAGAVHAIGEGSGKRAPGSLHKTPDPKRECQLLQMGQVAYRVLAGMWSAICFLRTRGQRAMPSFNSADDFAPRSDATPHAGQDALTR